MMELIRAGDFCGGIWKRGSCYENGERYHRGNHICDGYGICRVCGGHGDDELHDLRI